MKILLFWIFEIQSEILSPMQHVDYFNVAVCFLIIYSTLRP